MAIILVTGVPVIAQDLSFKDPVLESGLAGQNGSIYRFPRVIPGVDALVQIKARSHGNVELQDIDVIGLGCENAFQPQVGRTGNINGNQDWWLEFEIRFVKEYLNQDMYVNGFDVTAFDLDGDGSTIREYVEFYRAQSSYLQPGSEVTTTILSNGVGQQDYRFSAPLTHFLNIDTSSTSIMGSAKYARTSKLKLRVGAASNGQGNSGDGMRFNAFWFRSFTTGNASTLPVKLSSFNATLASKNVVLKWTTEQEMNASHFTIQRSTDGIEYTDAAIIFTDGNSNSRISYSFKDPVATAIKGILYYRLKMVDVDGRFDFSTVRLIKFGNNDNNIELQTYPNPVVNELRITIPQNWQNKDVIYELYSENGRLIKRLQNKNATQTEVISMQGCNPGTYIVKAVNDKDIATQRVVKSR